MKSIYISCKSEFILLKIHFDPCIIRCNSTIKSSLIFNQSSPISFNEYNSYLNNATLPDLLNPSPSIK